MSSSSPLSSLVEKLISLNIHGYIVPSADCHQSEYVAECDKRRAFISNFTGSAGTAVIVTNHQFKSLVNKHRLWTDGRYFLQANQQLSDQWQLMKDRLPETPKIEDWLVSALIPTNENKNENDNLTNPIRVGVDPSLYSVSQWKSSVASFKNNGKIQLVPIQQNLVDLVWDNKRPPVPSNLVFIQPLSLSGQDIKSKFEVIRNKMKEAKAHTLLVTALDDLAWLTNLRGSDIPFNPVFFGFLTLSHSSATLFIRNGKCDQTVLNHLAQGGIEVKEYNEINDYLVNLSKSNILDSDNKIWMDANKTPSHFYQIIQQHSNTDFILETDSPITILKAVKNEKELEGMRNAHIKDGIAVCQFFSWLEEEIKSKNGSALNEINVADKLEAFRAKQPDFVGLSFDTICGSGPSGSIIHYRAEPSTARSVNQQDLLLLDSGAQYKDGTTDITRTIHLGTPSAWEIETFTYVLQGHIDLASAIFPPNTTGPTLDVLARSHLWRQGLDYLHGTGHGVGSFLNVHEGPHGITSTTRNMTVLSTGLAPGMIVSNEPGYYEDGKFGIRIESLVAVTETKTKNNFNDKTYRGFETITLVPIQAKMINLQILSNDQLNWLNAYHQKCRDILIPRLGENEEDQRTKAWILHNTQPLKRN